MQQAPADGSAKALDEARMRVGVLEAPPHICQRGHGVRQADDNVEELADTQAAHCLVHIVLQPLGPGAERFVLCMHRTPCQATAHRCHSRESCHTGLAQGRAWPCAKQTSYVARGSGSRGCSEHWLHPGSSPWQMLRNDISGNGRYQASSSLMPSHLLTLFGVMRASIGSGTAPR